MKITRRQLRQIIREELSRELREITATPVGGDINVWPDVSIYGRPIPRGGVSPGEEEEDPLDADGPEDDVAELLDMLKSGLEPGQLQALEYMLKGRRESESQSEYIKRKYSGDPSRLMQHIIPGY